jgi:uncharacterized membrane protein (DUF485 family)
MDPATVTLGSIGIVTAFMFLYYTTGILLHFTTFDADAIPTYQERLRMEQSFTVPLVSIVLYAAFMVVAGIALLIAPAYAASALVLGVATLLFGLLYFLRQMAAITAIT